MVPIMIPVISIGRKRLSRLGRGNGSGKELKKDDLPVVIFIHELLDTFSGVDEELCIGNAEEIVSALEQSGKVVAVIQRAPSCRELWFPAWNPLFYDERNDRRKPS